MNTKRYRVSTLSVSSLWGERDYELQFRPDVNIIIGRNSSGKTTLLNLLCHTLTGDIFSLTEIDFLQVRLQLERFDAPNKRTITVSRDQQHLHFKISTKSFSLDPMPLMEMRRASPRLRRQFLNASNELTEELQSLTKLVWLPVSRRLPITEQEDDYYPPRRHPSQYQLESVDHRLNELILALKNYRLRLEKSISDQYKIFQRRVLEIILYSPTSDGPPELPLRKLSPDDKKLLVQAFDQAGLLDSSMSKRIDKHFEVATAALDRVERDLTGGNPTDFKDLFVLPLIPRTRIMVEAARDLEKARDEIFEPLRRYEQIVSSFLQGKNVKVADDGMLLVESLADPKRRFHPQRLSSGEKQVIILLTQSLLEEQDPVIYIADEPELSLHVSWQEKLLKSLRQLGGDIQIIVATHSPDIVGPFRENIIDLEEIK